MRFSFLISILTLVTCQAENFDPFTECLVPDLNVACTDRCESISVECALKCPNGDSACLSQCFRENTACLNDCPCEVNCLDGCDECDNPVCDCQVIEENHEWNRCIDDNSLALGRCVYDCENNVQCEDDCLARFKTRQLDCPCEENCSAGCPCSGFDCLAPTSAPEVTTTTVTATTTSPTGNAVLVLNTYNLDNKPFIVDFNGNMNEDLTLEYGDLTEVRYGCAATLNNDFWYFGGNTFKRQASKLVGCKLERQTDLIFEFYKGACNTFSQPEEKVLLCFGNLNPRECHTFDGGFYHSAGSSTYSHTFTMGMANYIGKALTTGCNGDSTCRGKTELMDMNTLIWSTGPDFPFTSEMYYYSTASTSNAAYIIGGYNTNEVIAEFKNYAWRQLGTLTKGRLGHASISLVDETMVIGGYSSDGSLETEIWNFPDENHKVINPTLPYGHYRYGIALYIVPFDFCTT